MVDSTLGSVRDLTPYLTPYGADTGAISGTRLDPEFANSLSKTTDLDPSGPGWTAPNVIRNQQVSGSSPLAGSNVYRQKRDPRLGRKAV